MAVDLSTLEDSLKRELNPPGTNNFPDAVDADWIGQLEDSFWEAKLYGFFGDYTASNALVQPINGTTDLPREQQQLVVLFAGIRVLRQRMVNTTTTFRAKAGAVEFETQQSTNLLLEVLRQFQKRIALIMEIIGIGVINDSVADGLMGRDMSLMFGDTAFWGAGGDYFTTIGSGISSGYGGVSADPTYFGF